MIQKHMKFITINIFQIIFVVGFLLFRLMEELHGKK
nr:MAG TPA: hypothetical protein [Bacteriophage sp.]